MSFGPLGSTGRVWPVRWAVALVLAVAGVNLAASRLVKASVSWRLAPATLSLALLAIFVVLYAVELGMVWSGTRRLGGGFVESVGMRWRPGLGAWIATAAAAAIGLRLFASAYAGLMLAFRWLLPGWDSNPTKYFPRDLLGGVVMVLIICVAAPIAEETIFRGILLQSLEQRFGEKWAIGATSVVFAALHLNLFTFVPILVVAWALSLLFLRSRSLWVSIAGHSIFNSIGILFFLLLRGKGVV